MNNNLPEEIDDYIKLAEKNLKLEVREAKQKRSSKLVAVSNSTGGSSKKSYFGSTTISSIESSNASGGATINENSLSESCTQIEDIEFPASFNSSTIGLEEMLSISNESSINRSVARNDSSLLFKESVKLKSENVGEAEESISLNNLDVNKHAAANVDTPERWNSCNTSGVNTFFLCSETERVLDALESEKGFFSPPRSRLTILDLSNLNDSLLTETPNFKNLRPSGLEGIKEVPSMSTPKNPERIEEKSAVNDCRISLNFNGTFNKDLSPLQEENSFVIAKEQGKKNLALNETKTIVVNTTFDKGSNVEEAKGSNLNVTFETQPLKENEDNMNRTFEVVGNGSFIIEGKCTNLMDMESGALKTILGSASNTPSRGTKSYPDTKKLSKSTLRKRLSMLTGQSQDDSVIDNTGAQNSHDQQQGSNEKALPASKLEYNNPLGSLTKEQVLSRLRKKANTGTLLGNNGPVKAVPLSLVAGSKGKVKQIEELKKRATSTPDHFKTLQTDKVDKGTNSEEKNEILQRFPSFGSVSSIGTDGFNSREVGSDEFMATPEVFRHRTKIGGPHITSTPTVLPCNLKFETDLGLGSAPTPIVAPVMDIKNTNVEKKNSSYVVENPKKVKNKLNFTSSNEGSNDSVFMNNNAVVTDDIESVNDDDIRNLSLSKEEIPKCEQSLMNEGIKNIDPSSTLASVAKENIAEATVVSLRNFTVLESDCQGSRKEEECVKVFTSTALAETVVNGLKSIRDSNLSSIKECDLSKRFHNEIIKPVDVIEDTVKSPKKNLCCQCGNVKKNSESEDVLLADKSRESSVFLNTQKSEISVVQNATSNANEIIEAYEEMCRNDIPMHADENRVTLEISMFLNTQGSELSVLQNATFNANEIIEAYEEMCQNDIPNFTNEFNDTKTDVKTETFAASGLKIGSLTAPQEVANASTNLITQEIDNASTNLTTPREVANASTNLTTPQEVANVSTNFTTPQEVANASTNLTTPQEVANASTNLTTPQEVANVSTNFTTLQEVANASTNLITPQEVANASTNLTTPQEVANASTNLTTPHEVANASTNLTTPQEVANATTNLTTPQEVANASTNLTTPQEVANASTNLTTPQEVANASTNLTTPHEVANASTNLTTPQEVANASTNLTTPRVTNSSTNSSKKINSNKAKSFSSSITKDTSKSRTSTDNVNLKKQTFVRRLSAVPSKPLTPRPSLKEKCESLPNIKNPRPALKPFNAPNIPSVRRRESLQKDLASNIQTSKVKPVLSKPIPKIKSALHARTFPEVKGLPPKPSSKINPLHTKTLSKSVSNDPLHTKTWSKSVSNHPLHTKTLSKSVSNDPLHTKALSKLVSNDSLHIKTLSKTVSNVQIKLDSARTKIVPNKLTPKVPKVPTVTVKSTNIQVNSSRTLVPKVLNTNTNIKSRINPQASQSTTIKIGSATGSRLSYSANKENGICRPKSMIGSGIRPPSVRTSIPVPRNFK